MRSALKKWGWKLRHEPQYFRQQIGGLFAVVLVVLAEPAWWGFWAGVPLVALGGLVRLWAAGHLHKDEELGRRGPYAFMRHPQYFGNSCLAVGLSLASGYYWAVLVYALIFYIFYIPAIREEDQKLRDRFGDMCREWQQKVPAVLPFSWPSHVSDFRLSNWSLWQAVQNGEPAWTSCMVMAVAIIYMQLPEPVRKMSLELQHPLALDTFGI